MPEHLTHVSEPRRLLFYRSSTGDMRIQLLFHGESFWMSQRAIAQLFGVGKAAISKHLKNIFASGELVEESAVSILETTAADGKNYQTKHYHLDAVIAVGYRVNSYQATQFRIWATKTLKEYVVKGFVIDDERLKQGQAFGQDYFDELLERIREIRATLLSEDHRPLRAGRRLRLHLTCQQGLFRLHSKQAALGDHG